MTTTAATDLALPYQPDIVGQDIDLAQLRPGKSYDFLIENRNASVQAVLDDPERLRQVLRERDCPGCGASEWVPLYRKDSLDIVQCSACALIFVNPIFDEEKYQEIYRSESYQQIVRKLGEDSHLYRRQRFGRERLDAIERLHSPELPKRFLDVGCSTGFVVEEARDRGWEARGLELNPSAVTFARNRGLRVEPKLLQELEPIPTFAAIGLYDVLEHLVDPRDVVAHCHDLLLPGGKLFIYVPNYNSASRQLLGEQQAHFIWPTHHLTYFTPETLRDFLERHGFRILHWETQGLDLADWHWYLREKTDTDTELLEMHLETLQFYINAAGHGKNLRMYAEKAS